MAEEVKHDKVAAKEAKGVSIASMALGIGSIVFSIGLGFILGILAIIFSAIGLKRKKNGFAVTGLVTGIIGVITSIVVTAIVIIVAYAAIQMVATDSTVASNATTVQTQAEGFAAENGAYPSYYEIQTDLNANGYDFAVDMQGTGSGGDIIYIPCYGYGAIIWYWSGADEEYKDLYLGDTTTCEWNE